LRHDKFSAFNCDLSESAKKNDDKLAACSGGVMSDASDFLAKWVRKNITPTTAHFHNDALTAGRLAEECLWEAGGQNLTEVEVVDAAGGNLLTFMVSELNRAADLKIDDEGE
jgi:hypothetical protein